jgi:hypothetical protein
MGNGALPHGPSDRAHPRLYHRDRSLRSTNSVGIGGKADVGQLVCFRGEADMHDGEASTA